MAEQENPDGLDLFGNPVFTTKGKRGRPKFQWTEENSRKVSMLLGLGWSNSRIASCVVDPRTGNAISEPTLKRYFRSELSERNRMRDRLDARRFERTWDAAEGGNIGAERLLMQMIDKNDLMGAGRRLDDAQSGKDADKSGKEQKLGKKEAAQQAAHESAQDSEWGADLDLPGFRPN
ncbi:hypothetical protein [Tritonibacter mobilis]|uniref:hypothetical protein n=1 Tax=Tritonibacter mobilis TaxID=379347 RepID=UPI0018D4F9CB|nr:hypothetical protein [Tritonibacter mobilis]